MMIRPTRRDLLRTSGCGALALTGALLSTTTSPALAEEPASLRARFHLTPPRGWLCDPQRPILTGGTT